MPAASREPVTGVIDAYCHVGLPRFGSGEDALAVQAQHAIEHTVLVLGPAVPDYATLFQTLARYGDRVRGMGIPFGATEEQVAKSVALQLRGGVLGLRVQGRDWLTHPDILQPLGRTGRWLYAISFIHTPELVRTLLDWLERYPDARLGAPHFLAPGRLLDGSAQDDLRRELLLHPRFYPIFSRHGGVGSCDPYLHADLRPWVEQVIELAGWDRILWGSEYPVLYWRNETLAGCRDWLQALSVGADAARLAGYMGGNAARALFADPPPAAEPVTIPAWVEAQFDRQRTVPLFQPAGLDVPMSVYSGLHHRFVTELQARPDLTFAAFVVESLDDI